METQPVQATETTLARAHRIAGKPFVTNGRVATKPKKNQLDPNLLPWDYQPFDSLKSYRAFEVYLALGFERSLQAVSDAVTVKRPNVIPHNKKTKVNSLSTGHVSACNGNIHEWSRNNLWTMRARAWDAHLASLRQQKLENEIDVMNATQSTRFERIQKLAESRFDDISSLPAPVTWKEAEVILKLLVEGAKGERVARGLGVEPPGGTTINGDFNLQSLSMTDLKVFLNLHSKVSNKQPDALPAPSD